jgi:glycosyltransferase involved in cell wall biosynthesis
MHGVKDQLTLVRAFIDACENFPEFAQIARLILIGDGPLRAEAIELLNVASLTDKAWLPGERDDIPEILRSLDIFVLPSKAEGISNTILEAMASGLPVIATRVGGNPELVLDGKTGCLVEKEDVQGMSSAMRELVLDDGKRRQLGEASLQRIQAEFSIDSMVNRYRQVYDKQ